MTPRGSREPMERAHVVWDWNGTLLDDFDLTARIAGRTLETLGVPGVTGEDIGAHFRRPFSDFYARLFGRPVTADEYAYIREHYEIEYDVEVLDVPLQSDAELALGRQARAARPPTTTATRPAVCEAIWPLSVPSRRERCSSATPSMTTKQPSPAERGRSW